MEQIICPQKPEPPLVTVILNKMNFPDEIDPSAFVLKLQKELTKILANEITLTNNQLLEADLRLKITDSNY